MLILLPGYSKMLFLITFPWVFCIYSVSDSLIPPTLIKRMGACIATRWKKGCSTRTAAEGSLLPPQWTLPVAAHPAGALGKAQLGTEVNLPAQCPTASLGLVEALANSPDWRDFCVLLCGISGLCETVGFLPPSCRTHSRTSAHASLRKFFMIHAEIFPCWVLPLWTS